MVINGHIFYKMVLSGANALENKKIAINNMNVFPVPDGDTGINMFLTLSSVRGMKDGEVSLSAVSHHLADAALRSARGNSGAILSLFFRGLGKAFDGMNEADAVAVANAFDVGMKEAYKAVMTPTEGTILTVMRRCAEQAVEAARERFRDDLVGLFAYLVTVAETELARTPELLPILKESHVVDAGAYGFTVILEGMLASLNGEDVMANPQQESGPAEPAEADFTRFNTEDVLYVYCTECIVEKDEAHRGEGSASGFYAYIRELGDSAVFIDDDTIIKLHVHTNDPGLVLQKALTYGSLATVKVENMKLQHSAKVLEAAAPATPEAAPLPAQPAVVSPEKDFGFVAVCMGDGLREVFTELGVDEIIYGGQTMNPSTQDLLDAVLRTPARTVFVLPNNKNIHLVAEQAASLCTDRCVKVLPTRNVPQGIAALLSFDESANGEENEAVMQEAMARVTCLSTTHAVRDSQVEGVAIRCGQAIGLVNEKIRFVADNEADCVAKLVEEQNNATMATVFYGDGVSDAEAEQVADLLSRHLSADAEISLIRGGQPIYNYIISLE